MGARVRRTDISALRDRSDLPSTADRVRQVTAQLPALGDQLAAAVERWSRTRRLVVSARDLQDADPGANGLQNYPVIASAVTSAGITTIDWTLDSSPGDQFRIEFYASGVCDGSGHGEGRRFLGDTTAVTDGNGNATDSTPTTGPTAPGQQVVATATLLGGAPDLDATSELSACVTVVP